MPLKSPSDSDPRARPKPFTFYPPKTNRFVIRLAKMRIERIIRKKLQVTEIEISPEDLERLRQLKGERCLVTPSHSGGFEPHIILYLSKLLQDEFNFVAAMELFEQSPIYRWLMPRLGVYSIIRGAVDRPSFSTTRKLLAAGRRWLVIFPEGQTIWQNSTVIPFQEGVIQLAFKAYGDVTKGRSPKKKAATPDESLGETASPEGGVQELGASSKSADDAHLHCIPIAIKYVYLKDMHAEIDASLARLEFKLSLSNETDATSRYTRLHRIGQAVLLANEKVHQISASPESEMDERIQSLKVHIISRLEHQLGVTPSDRQTLLDRIRTLFNTLDRVVYEEPTGSEYEHQLAAERQQIARGHYEDVWRMLQFVAIYDGYVRESMTFERFLDVLCLLEMEVFKERRIWGPRKACIKVGEPIDLKDRMASYAANKRDAVRDITMTLESTVRKMLEELGNDCDLVDDTASR